MDTATKMDGLNIPFLVSVNNVGGTATTVA